MKKTYTSAQGKQISMDSIRMENEHVIAVGNMKVNARGDQISDENKIVASRTQQTNAQYNKQVQPPRGQQ